MLATWIARLSLAAAEPTTADVGFALSATGSRLADIPRPFQSQFGTIEGLEWSEPNQEEVPLAVTPTTWFGGPAWPTSGQVLTTPCEIGARYAVYRYD